MVRGMIVITELPGTPEYRNRLATDNVFRAEERAIKGGESRINAINFYPKAPGFGHGKCWQCGGDMWANSAPPLIPPPRRGSKYCSSTCRRRMESKKQSHEWRNNPEFRERKRVQGRQSYARLWGNNPEYRERKLKRSRARQAARGKYRKLLIGMIVEQAGECYYCKSKLPKDTKQIHVDHIIPISAGGTSDVSNLCVACSACNLAKGTMIEPHLETTTENET